MATSAALYRKIACDTLNVFEYVEPITAVAMTFIA